MGLSQPRGDVMAKTKPPVPGAVRCYRLAPADSEDAYGYAAAALVRRGWNPVELDYVIGAEASGWVMVELWAIPGKGEE